MLTQSAVSMQKETVLSTMLDTDVSADTAGAGEIKEIESRFGKVTVNYGKALYFPKGILGFPPELHFALTEMPLEHLKHLKLLQSLNDHSISFVVLPLDLENTLIEKEDMLECAKVTEVPLQDLVTLLIMNVRRTPEGNKVLINVRAPIIIDANRRMGVQFVFPHTKYNISHPLQG